MKENEKSISEKELITGYKELIVNGRTYHIFYPSLIIKEQADISASAKYRELLTNPIPSQKLLTHSQISKLLLENGDWTPADDQAMEDARQLFLSLNTDRAGIESALSSIADGNDRVKLEQDSAVIGKKISEVWNNFVILLEKHETLFANTIESFSNLQRQYALLLACIKDSDNKPVWNSMEDLKNESMGLITKLLGEATSFWQNATSEESISFFGASPEEAIPNSDGGTRPVVGKNSSRKKSKS